MRPSPASPPPRLVAARKLVIALRALTSDGLGAPQARAALEAGFGAAAGRVLVALQLYLARVAGGAQRRVLLARPCCPCLSPDEAALIDAAARVSAGDWTGAHAALDGLVRPEAAEAVVSAAAALGEAAADAGLPLPMREGARARLN
ncbi:MAG: hypothetical protein ACK40H_08270 [Sphingomonadaceae bacterium]